MVASARSRLGVIGGTQEAYTIRSTRVQEASKQLQTGLKGISELDKSGNFDASKTFKAKMAFLTKRKNAGNKDVALAARKELMKYGGKAFDIADVKTTADKYLKDGVEKAEFANQLRTGKDMDPMLAYEKAVFDGDPPDLAATRYFGKLLANPDSFSKLPPPYLTPGTTDYNNAVSAMKLARDKLWPGGPYPLSDSSPQGRAFNQARRRLQTSKNTSGQIANLANDIFS
jgi:hypothetical protein